MQLSNLQADGVLFKIVIDIVRYSSNILFPNMSKNFLRAVGH